MERLMECLLSDEIYDVMLTNTETWFVHGSGSALLVTTGIPGNC